MSSIDPPYNFPKTKLKPGCLGKIPLVLVACGSYSPVTYLHLRMFEMAKDYFKSCKEYYLIGAYFSPVSDAYAKPGLVHGTHRVKMCELAVSKSDWIMVDHWETLQPKYVTTAKVLDHFNSELNNSASFMPDDGSNQRIKIMLLAGGDLIQSFAVPNLWKTEDVDHILGNYGCVIVVLLPYLKKQERSGSDVFEFLLSNDLLFKHKDNVFVIKQYIHNDISSTKIRLFNKRGMTIRYLLPNSVINYISENSLYK